MIAACNTESLSKQELTWTFGGTGKGYSKAQSTDATAADAAVLPCS